MQKTLLTVEHTYKAAIHSELIELMEEYIPAAVLKVARDRSERIYIEVKINSRLSRRFIREVGSEHLPTDRSERTMSALSRYTDRRCILELMERCNDDNSRWGVRVWGLNSKKISVNLSIEESDLDILDILGWLRSNDEETRAYIESGKYVKQPGDKYSKFIAAPKIDY
jgi:hypothetical protein